MISWSAAEFQAQFRTDAVRLDRRTGIYRVLVTSRKYPAEQLRLSGEPRADLSSRLLHAHNRPLARLSLYKLKFPAFDVLAVGVRNFEGAYPVCKPYQRFAMLNEKASV